MSSIGSPAHEAIKKYVIYLRQFIWTLFEPLEIYWWTKRTQLYTNSVLIKEFQSRQYASTGNDCRQTSNRSRIYDEYLNTSESLYESDRQLQILYNQNERHLYILYLIYITNGVCLNRNVFFLSKDTVNLTSRDWLCIRLHTHKDKHFIVFVLLCKFHKVLIKW